MPISSHLTAVFLVLHTFLGNDVSSLRCYVCESEKNNCDHFDPTSDNFAKECPPDRSAACLAILSNGRVTFRDCESLNINDCSRANNIEYCYCSQDLCNGRWIPNADDEDDSIEEGSGTFVSPSTTVPTATVSVTTVSNVPHFIKGELQNIILVLAAQYFLSQYYY